MKYSIITPMHNSFQYMQRYFSHFELQTYKDFELIIVDDCSTDDSYDLLLQYMEKSDLNIKCYRLEKNMGPGVARNYALDMAKGEWVTFVDSDDWIEADMYEILHGAIKKENALISCCGRYDVYGEKKITGRNSYGGNVEDVRIQPLPEMGAGSVMLDNLAVDVGTTVRKTEDPDSI